MALPTDSKLPTPDAAEDNAFFPSAYSLGLFTSPKSDFDGSEYPHAYRGKPLKILVIAAEERYLLMENGTMFSTGNHPVETLVPLLHLHRAGFDFDIATLSGNPVKFELWALPREDEAVMELYRQCQPQLKKPLSLRELVAGGLENAPYAAIFIPGGHGALIGLPTSTDLKAVLLWAMKTDKFVISLCHGPAALLAASLGVSPDNYVFEGYRVCAFPDAVDRQTPTLGYMPGQLPWFFGAALRKLGVDIINDDIKGRTLHDRQLITGDSPLAANALGKLAAEVMLARFKEG